MFQDFNPPQYNDSSQHLAKLRVLMSKNNWDALLVPHNDEQRNEYLPKNAERLACVTGFTGSAGMAIITAKKAILFVDGRYTIQAKQQVEAKEFEIEDLIEMPPTKWLENNSEKNWVMVIDPWLHSKSEVEKWQKIVDEVNGELKFAETNPIDEIWENRPEPPSGEVKLHDIKFSGRSTDDKLKELRDIMQDKQADLCVLNDACSVSWLFNIRGNAVAHTPLALARAIIESDKVMVFMDSNIDINAACKPPEAFEQELARLAKKAKVMIDPSKDPYAILQIIDKASGEIILTQDPTVIPRSVKNEVEINGARQAHIRDAAAMTTFLAWLDRQKIGEVDEITAAKKLENVRGEMASEELPLRDISFDTISGAGENGAIVHYRVNGDSNRTLNNGELYLTDSGAQYDDGTTDVTRTIAIGEVGEKEKMYFTLVLKGHIAIQMAKFPKGTRGQDIDALARHALWQYGLDYDHGTGHGVGSYLSVHEGPQGISKRSNEILRAGQILSNEPGVYEQGAFGIRIENLVIVQDVLGENSKREMLQFENLTWVPIDRNLVDANRLTKAELEWLNGYHRQVKEKVEGLVDSQTRKWLEAATQPIEMSVK